MTISRKKQANSQNFTSTLSENYAAYFLTLYAVLMNFGFYSEYNKTQIIIMINNRDILYNLVY